MGESNSQNMGKRDGCVGRNAWQCLCGAYHDLSGRELGYEYLNILLFLSPISCKWVLSTGQTSWKPKSEGSYSWSPHCMTSGQRVGEEGWGLGWRGKQCLQNSSKGHLLGLAALTLCPVSECPFIGKMKTLPHLSVSWYMRWFMKNVKINILCFLMA